MAASDEVAVATEGAMELDLGFLCAYDPTELDKDIRNKAKLLELAEKNTTELMKAILDRPQRTEHVGVVAELPAPTTRLPREKPLPKVKAETKWEKFAKEKGIKKTKRSKMIFDEASGDLKPRYGYGRANDDTKDWLIEVPSNSDDKEDQFAKREQAKADRITKNKKQQSRNLENAQRLQNAGDPKSKYHPEKKAVMNDALQTTKTATASVGKFDKKLKHEPKVKNTHQKRQFSSDRANLSDEKAQYMNALEHLDKRQKTVNVDKAAGQAQVASERKNRDKPARPKGRKKN